MEDSKVILMAGIPILTQYPEEMKALSAATLLQTRKEPGFEAF
ncbi:hypothetical protein [Dyadobacter sp. NIV53]|nr:hypothetical protein [Dyadobacter sp. NIV53]